MPSTHGSIHSTGETQTGYTGAPDLLITVSCEAGELQHRGLQSLGAQFCALHPMMNIASQVPWPLGTSGDSAPPLGYVDQATVTEEEGPTADYCDEVQLLASGLFPPGFL